MDGDNPYDPVIPRIRVITHSVVTASRAPAPSTLCWSLSGAIPPLKPSLTMADVGKRPAALLMPNALGEAAARATVAIKLPTDLQDWWGFFFGEALATKHLRASVIIDYQNVHPTGHGLFDLTKRLPRHETLIDPLAFAARLLFGAKARLPNPPDGSKRVHLVHPIG